jgi:hypothetical protein
MPISQLLIELFLISLWLYSLYAIFFADRVVFWTIQRYENLMKFYAFDSVIKPTYQSVKIIRFGHIIIFIVLTIYIVLVYSFRF